ncbi:MAG: hypothetical protein C5B51_10405 [Terriglobia bacterium]|nr:MAG: hypothetical protein C5B51_10405 [Terriglobia bacterium]
MKFECLQRSGRRALLLVLGLLPIVAFAQTDTTSGAISGTVTDATHAVLPAVTVRLSGTAVMGTPATMTDSNGYYRFATLSPGDYTVVFEANGFGTVTRERIHISLGFTAALNVEMRPGSVAESITVAGDAPVIDVQANNVTTSLDAQKLSSLPGSRDFWAVIGQVPAVAMPRLDVGGSNALTQQPYTAYGLTSAGGVNRGEIEGIMVNEGAGGGGSDFYYTDYGAMAEVSVNAVGNTAQMPNPGVLTQFIVKTGGNQYHGDVYFDYENDSLEATNIDSGQIAKGLSGSKVLSVYDLNRLSTFRDFNADLGGYIIKDKLWWYGAYRYTVTDQRYPTLLDDIQHTWAPVYTGKATYNFNAKHRLIGFYQHENKLQPDYLGAIFIAGGRATPALMTQNTVWNSRFPLFVWKAEYEWIITPSLLLQVRTGQYHSNWLRTGKSTDFRTEDLGNNIVTGGLYATNLLRSRPQVNGSLSYTKTGWAGTHNFKFGGEYMRDTLEQPFGPFPNACNCVSIFNNGVPLQVYLYQSNVSRNGLATTSFYLNDTWQIQRRLTINVGIRFDRNRAFLPDQTGPGSQQFRANDTLVAFNTWGPRFGVAYDLTGKGKTVVKTSFGQFYLYPGADFATSANPNPPGWYKQYAWTDANANGHWDAGEEGRVISVLGGTASTALDPHLRNTYTLQGTGYVEHQVASNFAIRTGFVWNGRREVRGNINVNRPFGAYNVPVTVTDPGPNGKTPGNTFTAYALAPSALALSPVNITTNLPANSNYYTWEITATKRDTGGRWTLLGSFAKTWSRETAIGAGSSFTPNSLINTIEGKNEYTNWQGKINLSLRAKWAIQFTPVLRVQSGVPFGRTFVSALNYGSATILAEPFGSERTAHIALFDVRTEKVFRIKERISLAGFFDVYNVFNTNAEQAVATNSGSSFLRPSAITPPRIARLGVKFQF